MFYTYVYAWTADAGVCVENTDDHITVDSGEDNLVDDTTCSYVSFFDYNDGEDSALATITASTQIVTLYFDNAVLSAASAFALVGTAALFF
jgi:hypothetical protein